MLFFIAIPLILVRAKTRTLSIPLFVCCTRLECLRESLPSLISLTQALRTFAMLIPYTFSLCFSRKRGSRFASACILPTTVTTSVIQMQVLQSRLCDITLRPWRCRAVYGMWLLSEDVYKVSVEQHFWMYLLTIAPILFNPLRISLSFMTFPSRRTVRLHADISLTVRMCLCKSL